MKNEDLAKHAAHVRRNIVKMLTVAKSGHPGGSLSVTDILQVLYFETMNVDAARPDAPDRDRFVLSKGHAAPALYATLVEKGYFPDVYGCSGTGAFSGKRHGFGGQVGQVRTARLCRLR